MSAPPLTSATATTGALSDVQAAAIVARALEQEMSTRPRAAVRPDAQKSPAEAAAEALASQVIQSFRASQRG